MSTCKQIDFRILAQLSNDTNMLKLYENDGDLYTSMISEFCTIPGHDVTKDQRMFSKIVCLGILFTNPSNTCEFIRKKIKDEQYVVNNRAINALIVQFIKTYPSAYKFIQENKGTAKQIREFEKVNYPTE